MEDPSEIKLPASLAWLKRLILGMTIIMVLGVAMLIGLMIVKVQNTPADLSLPAKFALPEGAQLESFSATDARLIITTRAQDLLIYDRGTGALLQELRLP